MLVQVVVACEDSQAWLRTCAQGLSISPRLQHRWFIGQVRGAKLTHGVRGLPEASFVNNVNENLKPNTTYTRLAVSHTHSQTEAQCSAVLRTPMEVMQPTGHRVTLLKGTHGIG